MNEKPNPRHDNVGSKRFVLSVACTNDLVDAPGHFVIDITPRYARTLLARLRMVRRMQQKNRSLYKLHWWDYSGDYFAGDPDDRDADAEPQSMECNQMVISDDIIWKAIVKHTDVYASTDALTEKDLRAIVRRSA